jgi:hypothetical protein
MSGNTGLVQLYQTRFSTLLEMKLQQKGSKLRSTVREGSFTGAKIASPIQQLGAVNTRAPAGRFAPLDIQPNDYTRRWISPIDRELPQLVDSFDELRTQIDVKGELVDSAAAACGRDWDDSIIASATGTAQLGQDAGSLSNETFDTTKFRVAVNFKASANVGMTAAKIIEAKRILRKYHNDLEGEQVTLVVGSQQESDMLNQVEFVSKEYGDRPVLVDGRLMRFLGFDIVVMERLPLPVSNQRGCLAYVKSGLHLGMWADINTNISIRRDLSSHPYQVYTKHSFGATRTQPGKVVQILAADTTGADITP